ncbi:MAG: glycosyltransferase family 9 protein [Planctomycetota bacterium]|nr:glycosyltransferase family 9 protein [Planctomycetota bacterium]
MTIANALRSIIVRLPNPLGDAVMALPLISNLKHGLPNCQIYLAGNPAYESIFSHLGEHVNFVELDNALNVFQQAKKLEAINAEAIILCPNSWSSAIVALLSKTKIRVGRKQHGRSLLLTKSMATIDRPRLMTDIYNELAQAFGIDIDEYPVSIDITSQPLDWLEQDVAYFMVAPGSAFGKSKQYPLPKLAATIDEIQTQFGLVPVLFGSPDEHDILEQLGDKLSSAYQAAPEGTSLSEILVALKSSKFLLCMDSGARHLAAAVSTPQAVIFGPTNPAWTAHSTDIAEFISHTDLECLGCHLKNCPKQNHPCMTEIPPSQIVNEVSRLLS